MCLGDQFELLESGSHISRLVQCKVQQLFVQTDEHVVGVGEAWTAYLTPEWTLQLRKILHEQNQWDVRVIVDGDGTANGVVQESAFDATETEYHTIAGSGLLQVVIGQREFVCAGTVSRRIWTRIRISEIKMNKWRSVDVEYSLPWSIALHHRKPRLNQITSIQRLNLLPIGSDIQCQSLRQYYLRPQGIQIVDDATNAVLSL